MLPRRRALLGALLLTGGMSFVAPASGHAQERAVVRTAENFRREPNGVVLGRLGEGTALRVLTTEGNWTEVELEGWVWLRSLQTSDDASFDLVVSVEEGENLRSGPSGTILARLEEGALLEELGRNEAWARVSRVGWVWSASVRLEEGSPEETSPPSTRPSGQAPAATGPAARAPGGFRRAGGGPILSAPDGDTLAVASPSGELEVLRREGSWARVRLEGWMWLPEAQAAAEGTDPEAPTALEPADLSADPEAYAGRVVSWTIQFISLERAEAVRTDFFEGEPFLLARFGGADGPYVYVAIPTDRVTEVEGLVPLERVEVTGRVRTGASSLTGAPIIDLISLARARNAR